MTGNAKNLLVVEDEEHLAAGLKLNCELEGYRVDTASTGREASERLLQSEGYDGIILDFMLPDMDGFELCRRLRGASRLCSGCRVLARLSTRRAPPRWWRCTARRSPLAPASARTRSRWG